MDPPSGFREDIGVIIDGDVWKTSPSDDCVLWDLTTSEGGGVPVRVTDPRRRHISLRRLEKLGEGGGGLALLVEDAATTPPPDPIVLKIAFLALSSRRERMTGAFINTWLLSGLRSPNFVKSMFDLVCPGFPPPEGDWEYDIRQFIAKRVPAFERAWTVGKPRKISYLGLGYGDLGDVFDFAKDAEPGIDQTRSIAFQLLHGLAALHEADILHRDIQNQNVVLSTYEPGDRPSLYWTQTLLRLRGRSSRATFYDPHLLELPEAKKDRTDVGKEPGLLFTVKFIDYGLARRVPESQPSNIFIHARGGVPEYSPPEMLFIDRSPEEIDPGLLRRQHRGGLHVPHTKASDLWSTAMIIVVVALGGSHPLFNPDPPPGKSPWTFETPQVVVKQMTAVFFRSQPMLDYMMTDRKSIGVSIRLMWNMVEAMGMPNNGNWPGIEDSALWKVIHRHRTKLEHALRGGWFKSHGPLRAKMGRAGTSMLMTMLSWAPQNRRTALHTINENRYFDVVREAGHLLFRRRARYWEEGRGVKVSRWGFREGWWKNKEREFVLAKKKKEKDKEKV